MYEGDDRPLLHKVRDALLATVCLIVLIGGLAAATAVIGDLLVELLSKMDDGVEASG